MPATTHRQNRSIDCWCCWLSLSLGKHIPAKRDFESPGIYPLPNKRRKEWLVGCSRRQTGRLWKIEEVRVIKVKTTTFI